MDPLLSVIIPSYNSGERILTCIEALGRQRIDLDFEVIVVDASDDGTGDLLEQLVGIKLIRSNQRLFPGTARNRGAAEAAGAVLCFTDADCIPAADWIANIWKTRPDKNRIVVGGEITNGTPGSVVGTAEYLSEFSSFLPLYVMRSTTFFPTANLAVGAEEFREVGGFRDFEKGSDVTFGMDCRNAGLRFVFKPSIRVTHMNRTRLQDFLTNQERLGWGAGNNRALFDLPHSWLVRLPPAWPLVPAARFERTCYRVLRYGRGQRYNFIKSLPAIALGTLYFGAGFARGTRHELAAGTRQA